MVKSREICVPTVPTVPEGYPERDFGKWKYTPGTKVLEHKTSHYQVEVELMPDAAACLDWIFQATAKRWCSPQDTADLVEAIRAIVNPQATLCSWGISNARSRASEATR